MDDLTRERYTNPWWVTPADKPNDSRIRWLRQRELLEATEGIEDDLEEV